MATRSGKLFRPIEPQTSLWVLEMDLLSTVRDCRTGPPAASALGPLRQHAAVLLQQVLAPYMDICTVLKARCACKAWAKTWGAYVPGITLEQPASVGAARSMGSKAAAAFPCAVKARIAFTSAGCTHSDCQDAASTAKALVGQLQLPALRALHVARRGQPYYISSCWMLYQILLQLPVGQLQVLDLTESNFSSSMLRFIAAHFTQLQRLVLPREVDGWSDTDVAALAAVPTLRELVCHPRPAMSGGKGESCCVKPRRLATA